MLDEVVALVALLLGLAIWVFSVWRPRVADPVQSRVYVWFFLAFAAAVLIFDFFPDTSAQFGQANVPIKLGGAIAGFAAVWWLFSWFFKDSDQLSTLQGRINQLDSDLKTARQELMVDANQNKSEPARPLIATSAIPMSVGRQLSTEMGIMTGDIENVKTIDVWVNSENTNMQMARFYEGSISSKIRYFGATRTYQRVDRDTIADELRAAMGGAIEVDPGEVIVTGPGELAETNRVKKIFHAAAVRGSLDSAYTQVQNVGTCVRRALEKMDGADGDGATSILFPMLGAGRGGGPIKETAGKLVAAAADYLEQHPDTRVRKVYFLAWTDKDLAALELAFKDAATPTAARI